MQKLKKSAEGLSLSELRRLKKKRKRTRKQITVTLLLLAAVCIGMLFTPVFYVSEIEIVGNEKVTQEEILAASGFMTGENIFSFPLKDAGEKISAIPYVNSVLIQRKLPDKIFVKITESIPMAYVPCMDFGLVIDKAGKALEACTGEIRYPIPVLLDFSINEFYLGEKIVVNDEENFKKTLEIIRDLYNNNFMENVKSIAAKDGDIILNLSEHLKVNMGNYEQFNSKIVMVQEVLKKLPENAKGTINAKNPNKVYSSSEY